MAKTEGHPPASSLQSTLGPDLYLPPPLTHLQCLLPRRPRATARVEINTLLPATSTSPPGEMTPQAQLQGHQGGS